MGVTNPLVTIVTVNINRELELARFFRSILNQSFDNLEIIIVDNGSDRSSYQYLKDKFPSVRFFRLERTIGMVSYNIGMKAARGDYLIITDNDVIFHDPETVKQIVSKFSRNPKLAIVACHVVDKLLPGLDVSPAVEKKSDDEEGYKTVEFHGATFGFKKRIFDEVGGYPHEFRIYMTELALATKILAAGHEVRFFPEICVTHVGSHKSSVRSMREYYMQKHWLWYNLKYSDAYGVMITTVGLLLRIIQCGMEKKRSNRRFLDIIRAFIHGWAGSPYMLRRRSKLHSSLMKKIRWLLWMNKSTHSSKSLDRVISRTSKPKAILSKIRYF
ncbi:MAG: glycosyltransferase family 2 protein [Candidatus Heimdallarchaeota archaeon]